MSSRAGLKSKQRVAHATFCSKIKYVFQEEIEKYVNMREFFETSNHCNDFSLTLILADF